MDPVATPRMPVRVPLRYHTAYGHGNVTRSDGSFEHYVCILDDTHKQLGHWRFASYADDQRAHALGFRTPEQLLAQQARSKEPYDAIHLLWVPGTNDPNLQTAVQGTVAEHLHNIFEVRKVLDMPPSLQGEIPLLPVSQDTRLKQFWEEKLAQRPILGFQIPAAGAAQSSSHVQAADSRQTQTSFGLSALPGTLLLPSPSVYHAEGRRNAGMSPATSNVPTLGGISKHLHSGGITHGHQISLDAARAALKGRDLPLSSGPAPLERKKTPAMLSPREKTPAIFPPLGLPHGHQISLDTARAALKGRDLPLSSGPVRRKQEKTPAILPALALPHESVQPASDDDAEISKSKSQGKLPRGNAHSSRSAASTTTSKSPLRPTFFQSTSDHVSHPESSSFEDQFPQSGMSIGLQSDPVEENAVPESLGMIHAEERRDSCYDDTCVYSELPCMDCGEDQGHLFDCNLGKLEKSMTRNLTILDYYNLAKETEYNDPGPWTTHWDPNPSPPPEDPEEVIQGMAEVIRNEESYKNDSSLHALPDELMILLWAFKTSPSVQVLEQ
ncbi:hypothetical protein IQ07DRAFT_643061 [Pyrenochaeta sp. DS3sAY3a]|nr:hypothetical protein IQ07DRAFT_643061 [Pyrenochaeta sp. DS3sAY3a]